jgi:DnaJ-domain-containing protein 1
MQAALFNFIGFYIVTLFLFGLWQSSITLEKVDLSLRGVPIVLKVILALHLLVYILNKSVAMLISNYMAWFDFVIDKPSFFVHEAGHVYFKLFGTTLMAMGGTITEVLLPSIVLVLCVRRLFLSAASLTLFWIGQILHGTSLYIASAPGSALNEVFVGIHDWNYLLNKIGLLHKADTLASIVWWAALLCMCTGFVFYSFTIFHDIKLAAVRFRDFQNAFTSSSGPDNRATRSKNIGFSYLFAIIRHYARRYLLRFFISPNSAPALFDLTIRILVQVAMIDGKISANEVAGIERFAKKELALSRKEVIRLLQRVRTIRATPSEFEASFRELYEAVNGNSILIEAIFDVVIAMAHADQIFSPSERNLWERAGNVCKLSPDDLKRILARHQTKSAIESGPYRRTFDSRGGRKYSRDSRRQSSSHSTSSNAQSYSQLRCYAILGARSDEPMESIKKKYRTLVKECHPDAVLSLGAPEKFRKTVESRFREIQGAYEEVCAMRKGSK